MLRLDASTAKNIAMKEPYKLNYSSPPEREKRVRIVIRVLVGFLSLIFFYPTVMIFTSEDVNDGPISKVIGITVTLLIAFYLGYIALTGRLKFRRE